MWVIYSFSIAILNVLLVPTDFPQVVLSVEKTELGISAGLQDRVIQTLAWKLGFDMDVIDCGFVQSVTFRNSLRDQSFVFYGNTPSGIGTCLYVWDFP